MVSVGNGRLSAADMRAGLAPGSADRSRPPPGGRAGRHRRTGSLDLNVDFVEELGATQLFHGKVAAPNSSSRPRPASSPPTRASSRLSIDARNVHLFDPKSGLRLGRA